jgi:hypothetical protein
MVRPIGSGPAFRVRSPEHRIRWCYAIGGEPKDPPPQAAMEMQLLPETVERSPPEILVTKAVIVHSYENSKANPPERSDA